MAKLRIRLNNNGELDDSGIPDCRGLYIGDYLDGLDLSGIAAAPGGTAPQPWNDTYKNNSIVLSGFNMYKGVGGPLGTTKSQLNFTFRNCICTGHMNATETNAGGYAATEMRTFLEGALKTGLQNALGDYLLTVRRILSVKGSWAWESNTVFLLTEYETWGAPICSEIWQGGGFEAQYPIYQKNATYKLKRYNGAGQAHWTASPSAFDELNFCDVTMSGVVGAKAASEVLGISPAFCVA
jgi:hypothetical protein